jgi:hypothetical protein
MDMTNLDEIKALQSNLIATFETPQGKSVMAYIEKIGSWYPRMSDSGETNEIIARDANRRLIGTIKTMMTLTPDQIAALSKEA